jgi:hypothetical protein
MSAQLEHLCLYAKHALFGFLMLILPLGLARAQEPGNAAADADSVQTPPLETGDYEIDYEEEPDAESSDGVENAAQVTPTPIQKGRSKSFSRTPGPVDRNVPSSQGTRSKNKFAPLLKSETKSIYKKNGRPLDVDTD